MAQVTTSLATPTVPRWIYNRDADGSTVSPLTSKYGTEGSGFAVWPHDTTTDPPLLSLIWKSSYSVFQVQWRTRKRYSPAHAAAVYGTTGEQWTDWGEWDGASITGTETSTEATNTWAGWVMNDLTQFQFVYDFSEYDQLEVQARVRVYDAATGKCSEWATNTLIVGYKPSVNVTASQNSDGSVTVSFASNWPRGGTASIVKCTKAVAGMAYVTQGVTGTDNAATVEITIPKNKLGGLSSTVSKLAAGQYKFLAAQNVAWEVNLGTSYQANWWDRKSYWVAMTKHANPSGVVAPVVSVDSAGNANVTDANYSAVFASVWWQDEEARPYASEVEMQDAGNTWTGALVAPPYDVPLTIRAVAVSSDGTLWAQTLTTTIIDSGGKHSWMLDSGESVSLTLRQDMAGVSISEKPESETIKPAGRTRPVSRHGTGGTRELSVSGVVLRGSLTDTNTEFEQPSHAEIMALLRIDEDMWFRTPGGGRYRVLVTGFSTSQYREFETISVDMEEVG